MPEMLTIREQWDDFKKKILSDVSDESVQMRETRRAFYAGAGAFMCILLSVPDDEDFEQGAPNLISKLDEEIKEFFLDVGKRWEGRG